MATAGTDSNAATDPECFRGGVVRLVLLPLPSKIVLSVFFFLRDLRNTVPAGTEGGGQLVWWKNTHSTTEAS